MIVDCAHYLDGVRQGDAPLSLDEAAVYCHQGGFVWLGMFEPSSEEMDRVRNAFSLHELAVEDDCPAILDEDYRNQPTFEGWLFSWFHLYLVGLNSREDPTRKKPEPRAPFTE